MTINKRGMTIDLGYPLAEADMEDLFIDLFPELKDRCVEWLKEKGDDLKYSNNSSLQLVTSFLCHFLSSLNCITDSGRRDVKFPRQIHHRHS